MKNLRNKGRVKISESTVTKYPFNLQYSQEAQKMVSIMKLYHSGPEMTRKANYCVDPDPDNPSLQLFAPECRVFPDARYCIWDSQKRVWDPQKMFMCVLQDSQKFVKKLRKTNHYVL